MYIKGNRLHNPSDPLKHEKVMHIDGNRLHNPLDTFKDVATLYVVTQVVDKSGITNDKKTTTREVRGTLTNSNKPYSKYKDTNNTANVDGSMIFITSKSEDIPTSSKMIIRGQEFVTGYPMPYSIRQVIPVSFKEVHISNE